MTFIERLIYGTVALVISATVLASVLPILLPYLAAIFVLVVVARLVWVRSGDRW